LNVAVKIISMKPALLARWPWGRFRQTVYTASGSHDPDRPVAAFDFDSTLRPYRGRGPPEDFTLAFLAGLSVSFSVVIISNRSQDTEAALAPLREYVDRLDALTDALGHARATVYAPTAHDRDRKPHTGVWEHYIGLTRGGKQPRFVFYCGDAAGRPGDHSASDYSFALNIGAQFTTPEALFYGGDPWAAPASCGCSSFRIPELAGAAVGLPEESDLLRPSPLAIVLTGSPASGKSHLAKLLCSRGRSLAVVSRDAQGARHVQKYESLLSVKLDVIVDNTSPLATDRAFYAEKARAAGYTIVICHVATPKELCFLLDAARCQQDASGRTAELPAVALHTYWKRREPPTQEEADNFGASLVEVPFTLALNAPPEVITFYYQ
jgi:bifunctional polynucleotide phosphatase/kinase